MEGPLIFFFFIIVIVVAVVVPLAQAQAKKANRAWSGAARALGLTFQPGAFLSPRRIEGSLPKGYVIVNTFTRRSGKSSTTYTRYRVKYHQSLGLGLKLSTEGFFSNVGKLFGSQDIEVGNVAFDNEVVVKGDNARGVVEFLTPARQTRIRRALSSFSGLVIDDDKICWEKRGVARDARQIIHNVRRLTQLAWSLSGPREEDRPLDKAIAAQREGRLQEALDAVHEMHSEDDVEPLEARVLEGELLHMAGRDEEATRVFEKAREEAPDDPEIRDWAQHTAARRSRGGGLLPPPLPIPGGEPPPLPSERAAAPQVAPEQPAPPPEAPSPEPSPEVPALKEAPVAPEPPPESPPEVEPAPPATETAKAPALDVVSVCEDLFRAGQSSLDASRIFEERYEGCNVKWTGELKSLEGFNFDFVFGSQPGTKAILEVHEVTSDVYGPTKAQAVVQLPPEAEDALRGSTGQSFAIEGQLLKADGLMRNVYLKNGTIQAAEAG